jgi:hypothetical protein
MQLPITSWALVEMWCQGRVRYQGQIGKQHSNYTDHVKSMGQTDPMLMKVCRALLICWGQRAWSCMLVV